MMRRYVPYFCAAIGVILLFVLAMYLIFSHLHPDANIPPPDATNTPFSTTTASASDFPPSSGITATTSATSGMRRFYDQAHHFSLEYPDTLQVSEFPGAASSLMVAFKDPTTGGGFQVFAIPYEGSQITQQRFELDEPSGVMQDPQNLTIDGAAATEFYSEDQAMGETREVWFLHNGILYEVTTFRPLDSWLIQILETWKFV